MGGFMGNRNGAGRPYRRRRYFISHRLQGRFALCFLLLGLFIAFAAGGAIWHLSSQGLERQIFRSHVTVAGARAAFRKIAEALAPLDEAMSRIGTGDLKTNVPEGRVVELNETLDAAREALRTRVLALRGLQERMSAEVANTGAADGNVREEIAILCTAFREALPGLSDRT